MAWGKGEVVGLVSDPLEEGSGSEGEWASMGAGKRVDGRFGWLGVGVLAGGWSLLESDHSLEEGRVGLVGDRGFSSSVRGEGLSFGV